MRVFCKNIRIKIGHYLNGLNQKKDTSSGNKKPSDVKSMLIISDISMSNTQQGIKQLKKGIKEICPNVEFTAIHFNSVINRIDGETLISDTNREYISEEDFSFFFKIKNTTIQDYLDRNYDIIVLLIIEPQLYINFLLEYSRGSLIVGKNGVSEKLNFIINTQTTDVKTLAETIINTYKMIFANK